VKREELLTFLNQFAADRVMLVQRHEAGARAVSHYDFNNTYQYVINREDTHLSWLQDALAEYDAPLPPPTRTLSVPEVAKAKKIEPSSFRAIVEDDATHLGSFVSQWRPKVEAITHARHRKMLDVILGESLEHQRFFEQAASGFEDLLGRRTGGVARQGAVLPTRWME
jgi:hypothetical protein